MTAGLELRSVCGGYGLTRIVHDVDLSLAPNSSLAVLGRNGAGKTTLLGTVAGRVEVQAGTIRLDGKDLTTSPASVRCRAGIGFVPQDRQVFRTLTVHENLRVADLRRFWTTERVYALFPRLSERQDSPAAQLSGGEQQMLAIGRALMGSPRLLLLDEPFEGLAPVVVDYLLGALLRLRAETGMAMLLVEQHAELALELAEAVVVLSRGRIALAGSRDQVRARRDELERLLTASS